MRKAIILIDWIGCPRNVLLKFRIEDYLKVNNIIIKNDSCWK